MDRVNTLLTPQEFAEALGDSWCRHYSAAMIEELNDSLQEGIYRRPILSPALWAREAIKQMRDMDRFMRYLRGETIGQLNAALQEGIYG